MPAQYRLIRLPCNEHAVRGHNPGVRGAALGDVSRRIELPGFCGTGFACSLFRQHIWQKIGGFDVAARPSLVRDRNDADTRSGTRFSCGQIDTFGGEDDGWRGLGFRKSMIAPRNAARNLKIDQPGLYPVFAKQVPDDHPQRISRSRRFDPDFPKGMLEPFEMPCLVHKPAIAHAPDLIDGIPELIPPVFDMDGGLAMRNIAAIDIGNA